MVLGLDSLKDDAGSAHDSTRLSNLLPRSLQELELLAWEWDPGFLDPSEQDKVNDMKASYEEKLSCAYRQLADDLMENRRVLPKLEKVTVANRGVIYENLGASLE